jgi:membrane protease YdiL (CAAX protease family)
MSDTPPDVAIAAIAFIIFWLVTVLVILIAGRYHPAVRGFRDQMIDQWRPALVIAAIFVLGLGIGGRGFLNPYGIAIFCQALIGLAIANRIEGFEPLPVTDAFVQRRQILRQVVLLVVIAVLVSVPAFLIGTIGLDIGQQVFGETDYTDAAQNTLPSNKWIVFFTLLAGSGIAEETPYRLVLLSLISKLTRRRWLAITLSALVFGVYHLTPLSGMYRIFWQFPISQFLGSTLIGLVWGYLYIKRGYETTVLGHTLSNWLPLLFFAG